MIFHSDKDKKRAWMEDIYVRGAKGTGQTGSGYFTV